MTAPAAASGDTDTEAAALSPAARRKRIPKLPYALLVPAIAILALGTGYPLLWQLLTSFREYGLAQQFGKPAEWTGFDNYAALLTDPVFWAIVGKSILFCLVTAAATMILGVGAALLMRYTPAWVRLSLQVSMLLAWAMPVVAQMTVWTWLVEDRNGVVNYLLTHLLGMDMIGHNWLVNPWSFFLVASVIITWASVPFVAFSVYAGFTTISSEVVEAAHMDGASGFTMLRTIMLPIVKPVLSIVLLLQLIWDLRVFAQIKLLQDAGSFGQQYDLLGTYIYKLGTGSQSFGMAAAAAIVTMALTLVLSWVYVRHLLKEDKQA